MILGVDAALRRTGLALLDGRGRVVHLETVLYRRGGIEDLVTRATRALMDLQREYCSDVMHAVTLAAVEVPPPHYAGRRTERVLMMASSIWHTAVRVICPEARVYLAHVNVWRSKVAASKALSMARATIECKRAGIDGPEDDDQADALCIALWARVQARIERMVRR